MNAQATITYKWNAWAKKYLIGEGVLYLTWLIAFQIFVLLFQAGFKTFPPVTGRLHQLGTCACMVQHAHSWCKTDLHRMSLLNPPMLSTIKLSQHHGIRMHG